MSTAKPHPEIIAALKQKKKDLNVSNQGMVDLVIKAGKYVTKSTADRIFKEGSESQNFRYEDSLQPFVEVFLVEETPPEPKTLEDARDLKFQLEALQTVAAEKGEIISILRQQIETQQKRIARLDAMVKNRSICLGFSLAAAFAYLLFVDIPNPSIGLTRLLAIIFGG